MKKNGRNTAVLAGGVVLLLAHADMPLLAAGFVAPTRTAAHKLPRLPPWSQLLSSSTAGGSSSLASTSRRTSAAAHTRISSANCNYHRRSHNYARKQRTSTTCSAAGSASEDTSPAGSGGARSGSSSATSSPTAVQEGGGPIRATKAGGWLPAAEDGLAVEFDWEGGAGAAWTEFEDWLIQDTYSRYAVGSGKHVLWRRMVREVPELMERTPQEVRQRVRGTLCLHRETFGGSASASGCSFHSLPRPEDEFVSTPSPDPPVLEQWEEIVEGEGMGSFRGNVFGQRGLADGTAMTTAPVDVSGRKIQDQYVATQCGVVYELGERRETDLVGQASSNLLKIAPATVVALAGAFYALTALSHHVQVEVFVI
ncbi:unnamed protein product [Scytosiphon promiscuus]